MPPVDTRTPSARAAATVSAGCQNMSIVVVTPPSSVSASPSVAPRRTVSRPRIALSALQTVASQGSSGRSSTSPRNRLSPAWQWVLTSPGASSMPPASTTRAASAPTSAAGPTRTIRPAATATAPSRITVPAASPVTTSALVTMRSDDIGGPRAVGQRLARSADRLSTRPLHAAARRAMPPGMKLDLYAHPFSSYCQKVLIALYENATPFTFRLLGPDDPVTFAEFAAIWPIMRMPLLIDGRRRVMEFDASSSSTSASTTRGRCGWSPPTPPPRSRPGCSTASSTTT